MDKLLREKLDSLLIQNPKHWYITQQVDDFPTLCSCVDALVEFQEKKQSDNTLILDDFFNEKKLPSFRALNNARYLGLLTNEGAYEQEKPTDTFREIKDRVGLDYNDISKYQDIIDRQIEKFHFTSEIDSNQNDNIDFDIFGIIYLYKVLLEIGTITKKFEITDNEYDFLVSTTRKYEDFYQSIYLIMQARREDNIQSEYERIRNVKREKKDGTESSNKNFDERTKHLIRQNSNLHYENGIISIKEEKIPDIFQKVKLFENRPKKIKNYIHFLCSTESLIEEKKEDVMSEINTYSGEALNKIIFGAPGTGKSHKLETQSAEFLNQKIEKTDITQQIKDEITSVIKLSGKLNFLAAIGVKYADYLKTKSRKELSTEFNISGVDELYIGSRAKEIAEKIPVDEDAEDKEEQIKALVKQRLQGKDLLVNLMAIGIKFSEYLYTSSMPDLKKTYELKSDAQMWWLYRGAQAIQVIEQEPNKQPLKFLERVTFHPNYSYAQFVGTYKPVKSALNPEDITYEYVPGPFMKVYVNAKKNPEKKFLLLIEEINRANVAAVFGDVFQLLDRKADGTSEYPISISEDQKLYLESYGIKETEISIPSNMYIWATMNSADQGVFPMDTAFKRRWEFEYIGIDDNEEKLINNTNEPFFIPICKDGIVSQKIKWNDLRKAINNKLISLGINEDKLLGPFFLNKYKLESAMKNGKDFVKLFESKILMYLFEDAGKMKVKSLFNVDKYIYSEVCKKFETDGLDLFIFDDEDKLEPIEIVNKNEQKAALSQGALF